MSAVQHGSGGGVGVTVTITITNLWWCQQVNTEAAAEEGRQLALAARRDWREREKVQDVPAQPRNYFSYVCQSKDVLKVMNLFTNGLASLKEVTAAIFVKETIQLII